MFAVQCSYKKDGVCGCISWLSDLPNFWMASIIVTGASSTSSMSAIREKKLFKCIICKPKTKGCDTYK